MSPLSLRRYRAERLMRQQFEAMRARVLQRALGRLRASGVNLDPADLDACYAQAWQGLYTALLEGEEIANTAGWLVVVTQRRAIDEHRSQTRARARHSALAEGERSGSAGLEIDRDLAGELDDRVRLQHLFEGLRGRLGAREREAAVLCYLQGLSRAEAAVRMGVSEARMRKLMEGRGAGRPGVAGKVGELVEAIRGGRWCEQQGSLMRGLAYGVLDPQGERYQLALIHRGECPACRAYVAALRGLAAALPPVPMLARLASLARALAEAPVSPELAPATTPALRPAGGTAAGGSGAGGGWLMGGGSLGAKLAAAGCLVAAGVGAGGLALSGAGNGHGRDAGGPAIARTIAGAAGGGPLALSQELGFETARAGLAALPFASAAPTSPPRRPGAAAREFGLERPRSRRSARSASPSRPAAARPVLGWPAAKPAGAASGAFAGAGQGSLADRTPRAPSSAAPSAAEREFAPG